MAKRRLGKGIDALLQGHDLEQTASSSQVVSVAIDDLVASPHQPRKQFSQAALQELADSIRQKGVIQPILAEQRDDGTYEIIAGERRFRAARLADLDVVPVLTRSFTEEEKIEIALIENLQRQDLNPIEEAFAYRRLIESAGLTQEQLAQRLGINRSTVANAMRLLQLSDKMRQSVATGEISAGHGRVVVGVADKTLRQRLFDVICRDGISVREAERIASDISNGRGEDAFLGPAVPQADPQTDAETDRAPLDTADGLAGAAGSSGAREPADRPAARKSPELHEMQERLLKTLGTKVSIIGSNKRGRIQIDYFSMDDLERIYEIISGGEFNAGT